jgi:hypothetical protein
MYQCFVFYKIAYIFDELAVAVDADVAESMTLNYAATIQKEGPLRLCGDPSLYEHMLSKPEKQSLLDFTS